MSAGMELRHNDPFHLARVSVSGRGFTGGKFGTACSVDRTPWGSLFELGWLLMFLFTAIFGVSVSRVDCDGSALGLLGRAYEYSGDSETIDILSEMLSLAMGGFRFASPQLLHESGPSALRWS